ncbi:type III polyketide synthase [Pseudovibrio exalbescens]|uniref:type III polyketide synthase n=1 Tax=Pseudovibrio exalbescens TaxID=197461 RepID=UPI002366F494|nr:type III polyketide synthase [Pseudovibrio exalbescens]MDD7912162.1 type III polyketide synthase [Pseudovibrio exalbescens]
MPAYLHGLATAVPPHVIEQDEALARAQRILEPVYPQFAAVSESFLRAGIDRRHSVVPLTWFDRPKGWQERNEAYLTGASALFVEAARKALASARLPARDVDCIVTVSSTGIATPSLEAMVHAEMGFRTDVKRVPVFGLGCAGGTSGLDLARSLAEAEHGSRILFVCIELCTLSFRSKTPQKSDVVATMLFGDGAAAAVLSSSPPDHATPVRLYGGYQHLWPNTLNVMGWDLDEDGLVVVFDRAIPPFISSQFREASLGALAHFNLTLHSGPRFVCHPGGAKVIPALEDALNIGDGALEAERKVLANYGNMSAPTVLFVLKEALKAGHEGPFVMAALGPGFTASFVHASRGT